MGMDMDMGMGRGMNMELTLKRHLGTRHSVSKGEGRCIFIQELNMEWWASWLGLVRDKIPRGSTVLFLGYRTNPACLGQSAFADRMTAECDRLAAGLAAVHCD